MILVDTSVWVDQFRSGEPALSQLLEEGQIACHPFVIAEVALGGVPRDDETLSLMSGLAAIPVASHDEVMAMIADGSLVGSGVGYVDAHLLTSISLSAGAWLWTRDLRLARVAARLDLAAEMA